MNCKKCDRCGKYYPTNYEEYNNGSFIITTAPHDYKTNYFYCGDKIEFKDICDNCKRSFEKWMIEGTEHE